MCPCYANKWKIDGSKSLAVCKQKENENYNQRRNKTIFDCVMDVKRQAKTKPSHQKDNNHRDRSINLRFEATILDKR